MKRIFRRRISYLVGILMLTSCNEEKPIYLDTSLSIDQRVDDLVSRMTIEEKISQMSHFAPAIERLYVEAYDPTFSNPYGDLSVSIEAVTKNSKSEYLEQELWRQQGPMGEAQYMDGGYWNEALHGVARAGLATTFPQSIGLGATWNPDLIRKIGEVIGIEARVHNNVYGKKLTYWSPNINALRDPRWGRNEESYSEDPHLLSQMAVSFVNGLQGNHPKYLQAIGTVKHFVANNSEFNRHYGSSDIEERFLREYYLPAFKSAVREANVMSVMSAYNAVNGIPASANQWLLDSVLRREWGFKGYVVSDCGAISDIPNVHRYEADKEKAVAMAVKAGTDLECETCETEEFMYDTYLPAAFNKGYVTEKDIDASVKRLFKARMKLGEFDPEEQIPYYSIPKEKLDSKEHRELALQAARESIVLLKNDKELLPLLKDEIKSLAVIGPNADKAILGAYSGEPAIQVSPLQGISDFVGHSIDINFHKGCNIKTSGFSEDISEGSDFIADEDLAIKQAAEMAGSSDAAVVFIGTNLDVADEGGDRNDLLLPGRQEELIKAVLSANSNTIVVLINGMPLSINWIDDNVPAIVEAWYPGQAGGTAIAEVLFGEYNPGGKLPQTFHRTVEDLPPLDDYDITKGRTYWFYPGEVLYPFGHGLSYTSFSYSNLELSKTDIYAKDSIRVSFQINNNGSVSGDEVVQLYIRDLESDFLQPSKKLKRFRRLPLDSEEKSWVEFYLKSEDFEFWNPEKRAWYLEPGTFEIQIGGSSTDVRLKQNIKYK